MSGGTNLQTLTGLAGSLQSAIPANLSTQKTISDDSAAQNSATDITTSTAQCEMLSPPITNAVSSGIPAVEIAPSSESDPTATTLQTASFNLSSASLAMPPEFTNSLPITTAAEFASSSDPNTQAATGTSGSYDRYSYDTYFYDQFGPDFTAQETQLNVLESPLQTAISTTVISATDSGTMDPKIAAVLQHAPGNSSASGKQSLRLAAIENVFRASDALVRSSFESPGSPPVPDLPAFHLATGANLSANHPAPVNPSAAAFPARENSTSGTAGADSGTRASNDSPASASPSVGSDGTGKDLQSSSSGGDTSGSSSSSHHVAAGVESAATVAASAQPDSVVEASILSDAAMSATPSSTPQSAPPGNNAAVPSQLPSDEHANVTPTESSRLEPSDIAGAAPVQMVQIVDRAAQSEMRIGLNTSLFGSVEVRTVVAANDVGIVIGSEKGDLRSLLANELPGIASNLQQQNLRLNQVNFHQGFAFSGNLSSGGGDAQPRYFAAPRIISSSLVESSTDDVTVTTNKITSIGSTVLNILA
jgi:hypothetical protein